MKPKENHPHASGFKPQVQVFRYSVRQPISKMLAAPESCQLVSRWIVAT